MQRCLALALAVACLAQTIDARTAAARDISRRPASMENLFALREIGGLIHENVAASPSGDKVAFFEREMNRTENRYGHRLLVVDIATGAIWLAAEAGDIILESTRGRRSGAPMDRRPVWSPDGVWIYFLDERNGAVEIWRARAAGVVRSERVLAPPGDVRRITFAPNGALIFETSTPRIELAAQRAHDARHGFLVTEAFAPLYARLPLPDEDRAVRVFALDISSGETRIATERERALFDAPVGPVAVRALDPASTAQTPALGLFYTRRQDATRCEAPECDGALKDAWLLGEATPLVVFRRLEGHANLATALYAWRPGERQARLLRREVDRLEGCVIAADALVCLQDFAYQPRRLVRIDARTGDTEVLYDPNPEWRSVRLPRIERIDHTDGEGNQSFAQLVYPLNYRRSRPYPLVIVQYRARGFLNGGTGGETPVFPLSARGFFVLCVERPEFTERAARLSYLDLARETELDGSENRIKRDDILSYVSGLTRRRLVDPERIAITGLSDGAETVFDMLTEAPIFRAAIVGSPPSGPISYELQSRRFHTLRFDQFGMTAPWDVDGAWSSWWRENSASLRAPPTGVALMMNLPESEMLSAFPLLARLEATSTPVETYIYPGAFHLKWLPSQIWSAQERSIAWLDFWLRDVAPPDAAMRERWEAMRVRETQARPAPAAAGAASAATESEGVPTARPRSP
jgi:dipeptidyl aminopeptidase/acylaminoacyl peptidase